MAYMRIYCGYCGQSWEVYGRDMNDEHSRECPHCGSEIDHQTWTGQVLPALGQVMDANRELLKDHLGYHTPVFSFDVLADGKYPNSKTTEDMNDLRDEISELMEENANVKEGIAEMKDGIDSLSELITVMINFYEGREYVRVEDR